MSLLTKLENMGVDPLITLVYRWGASHTLSDNLAISQNAWALLGLIIANLFLTAPYWKHKHRDTFVCFHVFGILFLLPALWLHDDKLRISVLIVAGFGLFDSGARMLRGSFTIAEVSFNSVLDACEVRVDSLNQGWLPGQHMRIRVLDSRLGFGSLFSHPFTITNSPGTSMTFLCFRRGDWTTRLCNAASSSTSVRVLLDGPYGRSRADAIPPARN